MKQKEKGRTGHASGAIVRERTVNALADAQIRGMGHRMNETRSAVAVDDKRREALSIIDIEQRRRSLPNFPNFTSGRLHLKHIQVLIIGAAIRRQLTMSQ